MIGLHRRPRAAQSGARAGTVDPARVLRRRRSPLVFALGGVLVALVLVVEVLIFQAYANVNRSTDIFGRVTYLTGNLINVQRDALLLNVKIEELPTTRDLRGTQVRRSLLGNQLYLMEGLGDDDPMVESTLTSVDRDLGQIDGALARAKANPSQASLRAEVRKMRPAIRRATVRVKQLYDAKEQEFFGALSTTLDARRSSERLLVGLSGLVLIVGLAPRPVAAPAGPQGFRPGLPGPDRRGRGAQGGRAGAAGQRGAVPVAGPEFLGRDQHRRRRRQRPLPQ